MSLTGCFVPPVTGRQKSGDPSHEQRLEPAGAPTPVQRPDPLIWISEQTETPDRISKDFKDSRMIPGRCAGVHHPNLAS